jgi:hypothetical protein
MSLERGRWIPIVCSLGFLHCSGKVPAPAAGDVPADTTQKDRGSPTTYIIPVTGAGAAAEAFFTDRLANDECVGMLGPTFTSQGEFLLFAPDPRPSNDTPVELYWSVCNKGATGAGPTYQLMVQLQTINPNLPDPISRSPWTQVDIVTPTVEHCRCFMQAVGINRDVSPQANNQAQAAGDVHPRLPRDLVLQPDAMNFLYVFGLQNAPFKTADNYPEATLPFTTVP